MSSLTQQLVLHGSLVLFAGFIGGFFFARAIKQEGREVAWRVVHSGSYVAGAILIALAPIVPLLALPSWARWGLAWSLIAGTEAFVVGMYLAAITGDRGLSRRSGNRVVFSFYAAGVVLTMIGTVGLVVGAAAS